MPNKNYVKGRRKEYKVVNQLKKEGYDIAQRSAGSHSPIDIFAIDRKKKLILMIQVKADNYKHLKILKEMEWLNDEFSVKFCLY